MERLLLVYGALRTGGIETLIVRLANAYARKGVDTAVCCTGGDLTSELDRKVRVLAYDTAEDASASCQPWLQQNDRGVTLLSFDPLSAALGLAIEAGTSQSVSHFSGIYHPRAYFMTGERRDRVFLNGAVARAVGLQRLFFMNTESRDEHALRFHADLSRSLIIPLPVDPHPIAWMPPSEDAFRIVSVGRLVDFKQYNLGIPVIVADLINAGSPVRWSIYGTGPLEDDIRTEIDRAGVEGLVTLEGNLPYAKFADTVRRANLFVGLGTAALEAAMQGVPVIAATDSSRTRSYGWLHELPYGNLGERQRRPPDHVLVDLIREFIAMDEPARLDLSRRSHDTAMRYAMPVITAQFDSMAAGSPPTASHKWKRAVTGLHRALTSSALIRSLRKFRDRFRPL